MPPQLRRIGSGQHPLVIVDNLLGDVAPVIEIAAGLSPFPEDGASYYPGLRRDIGDLDGSASAYVDATLNAAGPYLAGAFDVSGFSLVGASFSMVTRLPDTLLPMQRAPHFDSTDPDYVALIHYLNVPGASGTAFFRQRSTGIERVDDANVDRFVDTAKREAAMLTVADRYMQGSNLWFEELDRVEAVPDRMVFYQGAVLHSGIIPPDMPLDPNPRLGRLTANFFIRLKREPAA